MEPSEHDKQPLSHDEQMAILAKINKLLGTTTASERDWRGFNHNVNITFNSPVIVVGSATSIDRVTEIEALQPELKDLLTQLQGAITTEPTLNNEDKTEALEQVQTLTKAGKNPNDGVMRKLARRAVRILKAIVNELPTFTKLAKEIGALLSAIATLFGL